MVFELTLLLRGSTSGATVTSGVMARRAVGASTPTTRPAVEARPRPAEGRDPSFGQAPPLELSPIPLSPYPLIPYRRACLETDRLSLTSTSQTPSFKFQPLSCR